MVTNEELQEEIKFASDNGKYKLGYVEFCSQSNDYWLYNSYVDGWVEDLINGGEYDHDDIYELLDNHSVTIGTCCDTLHLVRMPINRIQ